MAKLSELERRVAALVNTYGGMSLPEEALLPAIRMSLDGVGLWLAERKIRHLNAESSALSVPAGQTALGFVAGGVGWAVLPAGFLAPRQVWERAPGRPPWSPVPLMDTLPLFENAQPTIVAASWAANHLSIPLTSAAREVMLRYVMRLTSPTLPSDDVILLDLVTPVAYMAASEVSTNPDLSGRWYSKGRDLLESIASIDAQARQRHPAQRARMEWGLP